MAICENIIEFSLTLLRDLLSFENWRGGEAKWIRGGGIAPLPPSGYGPEKGYIHYPPGRHPNIL